MDALQTIFKGHVIAAACEELGITDPEVITDDLKKQMRALCEKDKLAVLEGVATRVTDKCTIIPESLLHQQLKESNDGVYNYARKLCHCAAITLEFTDGWAYGDGERDIRCWKILLLHFFASNRTKYALEALTLLFQLIVLPPPLVHQLTWGRFVNTHGGPGRNIPCDLFNEHVNKAFKSVVETMGANFTELATTRVARSITTIKRLSTQFDEQIGIHPEASKHATKADKDDVMKVVKVVLNEKLLHVVPGRRHVNFAELSTNPLKQLDWDKLHTWIKQKAMHTMKLRGLVTGVLPTTDEDDEGSNSDEDSSDEENEV